MLVADDDPTVLALVRTALQNFGMECHLAADGPKALDAARRSRPAGRRTRCQHARNGWL